MMVEKCGIRIFSRNIETKKKRCSEIIHMARNFSTLAFNCGKNKKFKK